MKKSLLSAIVIALAGCGGANFGFTPFHGFGNAGAPFSGRFMLQTPLATTPDFNPVLARDRESQKDRRLLGIMIRPGDQYKWSDARITREEQTHIPLYEQHEAGVAVLQVSPGSVAGDAGIRAKDIIVSWNDVKIRSSRDLINRLVSTTINEEVRISVYRRDENGRGSYKDISLALPAWDLNTHFGIFPFVPLLFEYYYNYFYWKSSAILWFMHFEGTRNYQYYRIVPFMFGKTVIKTPKGEMTKYDFIWPGVLEFGPREAFWL